MPSAHTSGKVPLLYSIPSTMRLLEILKEAGGPSPIILLVLVDNFDEQSYKRPLHKGKLLNFFLLNDTSQV